MNLIEALESVRQYATGAPAAEVVTEENIERKNTESLAQLDNMMKGVR